MKKFDIADALSLDKLALDYEWLRQTHIINQATELLADVSYKRDRAKAKWLTESAKLGNWIRSAPDEYNVNGTPTDAKVKEIVLSDPKIIELERIYHQWEAEVIAANGVRRAIEHKKSALEELTRLFLSGYWAKPYISQKDREKYAEEAEFNQEEELKDCTRLMDRGNKRSDENGKE